ncbi:MAG TPA: zinc ribbon domain-containing protein [Solirubrobacterales bacterium]|nr:zinc ribbon domain-containing protein [Solirubrobacterales bacterium]
MAIATFGINNNGLNLVVNLLILGLVVVWLALIVYTYLDAKRRISDPFLIGCATLASFIPYLGTAIYAIVRPPEFLEDAHERELEIRAAELRVRQLTEHSCPGCGYPVEKNFLRCPDCQRRLKHPCPSCSRPVDPKWALCPYCEDPLRGGERPRRKREGRAAPPDEERKAAPRKKPTATTRKEPQREAPQEPPKPKRQQRSPSREPDPDPRQA